MPGCLRLLLRQTAGAAIWGDGRSQCALGCCVGTDPPPSLRRLGRFADWGNCGVCFATRRIQAGLRAKARVWPSGLPPASAFPLRIARFPRTAGLGRCACQPLTASSAQSRSAVSNWLRLQTELFQNSRYLSDDCQI